MRRILWGLLAGACLLTLILTVGSFLLGRNEQAGEDAQWYLRLVNPENPMPEGYAPELAETADGQQVDARILEPLKKLLEAADAEGFGPVVMAGYRTWEKQQSLMDEKIAEYTAQGYSGEEAKAQAKQWVSVPGYSEHQLGLAVDLGGAVWDIYPWLAEHSWEYGFILRYPENKTALTGCQPEVWHFRYVGTEAAREMYEQGLCLEEYLAD